MNKIHVIHTLISFHILKYIFESGILVSIVSTVWKDIKCCGNKYRCPLDIYLITELSSLYIIIIYSAINSPGNGNNAVD